MASRTVEEPTETFAVNAADVLPEASRWNGPESVSEIGLPLSCLRPFSLIVAAAEMSPESIALLASKALETSAFGVSFGAVAALLAFL